MKTLLIFLTLSFFSICLFSQGGVAINNSGAPARESAILDVSSDSKAVLLPRMTTAQRTAIDPVSEAMIVYDTDLEGYYMYRESDPQFTGWREIYAADFIGIGNLNDALYDGWNIMLGFWAGRDIVGTVNARENVGLGLESLTSMEYGNSNVGIGTDALFNLNGTNANTGNNNTAVGRNSLLNITTGNDNTAIGFNAGPSTATLNNTVAIGANAVPTADNQIVLGTSTETVIIPGMSGTGSEQVYVSSDGTLVQGAPTNATITFLQKDIELLKSETLP